VRILGISAFYHDSAAALLADGRIVAAAQEERFTRKKQDARFPAHAIAYCLQEGHCTISDVDYVVFYEKPFLKFERLLETYVGFAPRGYQSFAMAIPLWLREKLFQKDIIRRELQAFAPDFDWQNKLLFTEHHMSHAASAFYASPFQEAAVLTLDGVGEWCTTSSAVGRGNNLSIVSELHFPHSLGLLYSAFTYYTGFKVNSGEYKLMGLAPYGQPKYVDLILDNLIDLKDDGTFRLDLDYFEFHTTARRSYSSKFVGLFGPPRDPFDPIDFETAEGQRFANCAASVQQVLEDILVDMTRALQRETGLRDLCLGGGVALNGVANARILAESGFERVFVPPAPGDAGCALGAALYADRIHFGNPERDIPDHPFWGPAVEESALAKLAYEDEQPVEQLGDSAMIDRVAHDLVKGHIVGWMDGALEFGPRALGNRSILAAPHTAEMRDRLNRDVKKREQFRPFAPVVPIEMAGKYFDLPPGGMRLARFMSGVFPVRPEWRARLAAVTHVDGTARVQTLERTMAPRLYALLEAYGRLSGLPVLLNTSFNLSGEPIVNRAVEGYLTFRRSGIDVLAVGQTRVAKRASLRTKQENAA